MAAAIVAAVCGGMWIASDPAGDTVTVTAPDRPRSMGQAPVYNVVVSAQGSPFELVPDGVVVPPEPIAAAPARRSELNYPRHSGR